ncbi:hypothetical protein NAEGRDRAFT_29577 [Naegleria gruberi]|uniref:Uncharacterized protein FM161 n=1 Tax=Naegleria gruberi TaxID=5762 RepID=D2UZG5_NAEGR|nr:uncharacterized protein NAEGRDRAFT_29577 [Naegleria gruberi]EFC50144.1 hypothetical protein NAEGRDRAFT_29577 [Naegleria gruberi]|eukprot:XP_002682888.1 hypothetical protein NAEGRDRAFT_29577 [Naegleria gruberi strain NEG-M]
MEFNHPPKDKRIRVSISGNILSGRDFDSEKYYIRYYLDMPSNFVFEDPMSQKLITSTQMGTAVEITKEYESYYEANFSFPFNFNCLCSNITPMPKLFFQVTSKDFWDRYRVEGYGFIALPSTPGYHNYTVNTWKPTGSIRNNLRSSFVGGSTELRDLSYTAIPNGFEQHFLNKFGFATDPSGSISVCLNVIYHGDVN